MLDLPSIFLVDLPEELGEEEGHELQLAGMHWEAFEMYVPGAREAANAYYERGYQALREERENG